MTTKNQNKIQNYYCDIKSKISHHHQDPIFLIYIGVGYGMTR